MDTLFWSREDGRYHVKINKLEQGNTLERMKGQRKIKCGNRQHTLEARRRKGRKNAPGSPFHTLALRGPQIVMLSFPVAATNSQDDKSRKLQGMTNKQENDEREEGLERGGSLNMMRFEPGSEGCQSHGLQTEIATYANT